MCPRLCPRFGSRRGSSEFGSDLGHPAGSSRTLALTCPRTEDHLPLSRGIENWTQESAPKGGTCLFCRPIEHFDDWIVIHLTEYAPLLRHPVHIGE
jgi:hypothetical protein